MKYLSKEEFKRLLKVIKNPRDRAIWTLGFWLGLRASEVGMLRFAGVKKDETRPELLRIEFSRLKNSVGGTALLNPEASRVVKAWLRVRGTKSGALFESNRGTGISRQQLDKLFKSYGRFAGLSSEVCHFHVLKHSIAMYLREQKVDLLDIQRWLGHRNANSTIKYLHVKDAGKDELALKVFEQF
jgi:integrase